MLNIKQRLLQLQFAQFVLLCGLQLPLHEKWASDLEKTHVAALAVAVAAAVETLPRWYVPIL